MKEYLVISIIENTLYFYKVIAENAKSALVSVSIEHPFRIHSIDGIYGNGHIAIPYFFARVFAKNILPKKQESFAINLKNELNKESKSYESITYYV